jgi:hypothetical protein
MVVLEEEVMPLLQVQIMEQQILEVVVVVILHHLLTQLLMEVLEVQE